jgi:chromosome segregation ATPase
MKRREKGTAWIRGAPTEEEALAEFNELLFALSHSLIDFTVEDAARVAKGFFAPAIRKALTRIKVEAQTIQPVNKAKQRRASGDYQHYRGIAVKLIAKNPRLRRATRNRLAQLVKAELGKQGRAVSTRTIMRAFGTKNKV